MPASQQECPFCGGPGSPAVASQQLPTNTHTGVNSSAPIHCAAATHVCRDCGLCFQNSRSTRLGYQSVRQLQESEVHHALVQAVPARPERCPTQAAGHSTSGQDHRVDPRLYF